MSLPGQANPTSPADFAQYLRDQVVAGIKTEVANVIKQTFAAKPEQKYQVVRQSPAGPIQTQVSLAQIMGELTDQLALMNAQQAQANQLYHAMYLELKANRELGEEMNKRRKKRRRDDDEEDE